MLFFFLCGHDGQFIRDPAHATEHIRQAESRMDDVAASSGPGDLAPVLEETSATTSIPLEDAPQSDISLIFVSIMNWWSSKIKEGESPAANRPQLLESRQDSKPEDSAKDSSSEEHEDDIDYCYLATQPDPDMIIEDDGWLLLDSTDSPSFPFVFPSPSPSRSLANSCPSRNYSSWNLTINKHPNPN